jgi:hypothetical protein
VTLVELGSGNTSHDATKIEEAEIDPILFWLRGFVFERAGARPGAITA